MDAKALALKFTEFGETFHEFKAANDARLEAAEKGIAESSEMKTKMDAIETKMDAIDAELGEEEGKVKARLIKAETKLAAMEFQRPNAVDPLVAAHGKAFEGWIRSVKFGDPSGDHDRLTELVTAQKAVSIGTPSAGGHAVPEEISRMISAKILELSPMRELVTVRTVGTSDWKELIDVHGGAGGWVGETDTRSETGTPSLEEVAPTMGIVYAYPKATEESLQDIFFNVQEWLVGESGKQIAKLEGAAIINGDGTNKPTGFLDGTPVAIGDGASPSPQRAFGILEYVPTGVAAAFPTDRAAAVTSPLSVLDPVDVLINCEYKLAAGHRANAQWLTAKSTLNVMRKWKDADGNYIWTRSMVLGQPSMLNGYPVREMEDMPAIAANTFPVAFGDFREGYVLVDRAGFSITIDDNITTPGYVKFYVRRRVGGILRNDDCIKVIKVAVT